MSNSHLITTTNPTAHNQSLLAKIFSRSTFNPETGCKIWQCGRATQGEYGIIWHEGAPHLTHRLSYLAMYGELPAGSLQHEGSSFEVHHRCSSRLCTEPSHLEVLTRTRHALRHKLSRGQKRPKGPVPMAPAAAVAFAEAA